MEATIGGTRRHLRDVVFAQAELGLDVHVVASAVRQPDFREELERMSAAGVGVLELPMIRAVRPGLDLRHALALKRHLRTVQPEIVHAHSSKAGVLGRYASWSTGIGRRVYSPHTFAFLHEARFGRAKRLLYQTVEKWFGARTDRFIAVSSNEGETLRSCGVVDPNRVRVVPNGIDPAPYRSVPPVDRAALDTPDDAIVAAVVGLLYEAKGQDVALRGLTRPGCERLHLWFAGEGERRGDYEALAHELGVADRAHFLGWRNDVPALLAGADFLVLPSRWEAMPYIVMEAMASGLPVVASRVDGVRDLVVEEETGFLCAVADDGDLAGACARMIELGSTAREAMGASGRRLVEERYSVEAMARGLVAVYEEVLGGPEGPG